MATFDSTKTALSKLLEQIVEGKIQLPDFQRGWVRGDSHIRSLMVSIARSFPIGSVMLLSEAMHRRKMKKTRRAKNKPPDDVSLY